MLDALPDDLSAPLAHLRAEVLAGIERTVWPAGASRFSINPVHKGNGVGPIKEALLEHLAKRGWEFERQLCGGEAEMAGPVDAYHEREGLRLCVEWETGNVASSYRVVLKMMDALVEGKIDAGLLIVSDKRLARYLTDRIGTYDEIAWSLRMLRKLFQRGYIEVVVMDADRIDTRVPLIPKQASGMGHVPKGAPTKCAPRRSKPPPASQPTLFEVFDVPEDVGRDPPGG